MGTEYPIMENLTVSTFEDKLPEDRSPQRPLQTSTRRFPKRIILVRHGESLGNVNESAYCEISDWRIPLTTDGYKMAVDLGTQIHQVVRDDPVFIYCSPYQRTKQTLHGIMQTLPKTAVVGLREEPQLTEQQFGNLQSQEDMVQFKKDRSKFGKFYYRFPNGESGLDVYNRVTSFIDTLFRSWNKMKSIDDQNVIMVTHGLTLRLFLMRWFQYTVEDFEDSLNPPNCGMVVLEREEDSYGTQFFVLSEDSKRLCGLR